jgi:hypothetical protein
MALGRGGGLHGVDRTRQGDGCCRSRNLMIGNCILQYEKCRCGMWSECRY